MPIQKVCGLVNGYPLARLGTGQHGIAYLLGMQGRTEVGLNFDAGFQRTEEVGQGVDKGVFVADGATGNPPVFHVRVFEVGHMNFLPAGQVVFHFDAGFGIGIFEVLPVTEKISRLILEHAPASDIDKQAREEGMISMKQDGYLKVLEGITTLEEVLRVAQE